VYPLKHKSDVFAIFKQWKVMIKKQIGNKVKLLRTDNGMKFYSMEFDQFRKNERMVWYRTVRYTLQTNRVTKRMNMTLLERARSILSIVNLIKCFYNEAVNTSFYLVALLL